MPKSKKSKNYRLNKQAFDQVIDFYRKFIDAKLGSNGVLNPEQVGSGGGGSKNPAKPTPLDFKSDVELVIKAKLPKFVTLREFEKTYVQYDSEDEIEREVYAQKLLGDKRHSVEQRLGEEFVRRGIFPVQGKGYFHCLRKNRA